MGQRGTDHYKEWAPVIMEAERSNCAPPSGWRPRRAGGIIQSESKGLRTRGAKGISPCLRAREGE